MTDIRTSQTIAGLWTSGSITLLLLLSGSVHSQLALSTSATTASNEERSGSNVASHKIEPIVDPTLTSLKNVDENPEAIEKIVRHSTIISKVNETQDGSVVKSSKLKVPEARSENGKFDEKRAAMEFLPEFDERKVYDDIHEHEDENDPREPTTPSPKMLIDKLESSVKSKEEEARDYRKKNPENTFSLLNDTNVNYMKKKIVKGTKDEDIYENDYKSVKSTLERPTNVIVFGDDDHVEKSKGPKSQVQVIKNSTQSISRLSEETVMKTEESITTTEVTNLKILVDDKNKMDISNLRETKIPEGKINDNKTLQAPKARTISFGGTNEFLTNFNKTEDSGRIDENTRFPVTTGITEKSVQEEKSTDLKPYPYTKVTKANELSNNSEISLSSDPAVSEFTEEASALENTIGQRQEEKKIFATESSIVINNGIGKFGSSYSKKSDNSSRTHLPVSSLDSTFSTTFSSLTENDKNLMTSSTESMTLGNETTSLTENLHVSNAKNVENKDTNNSVDPTGNGITQMMNDGMKNYSSLVVENSIEKTTVTPSANGVTITGVTESNTQVKNMTGQMKASGNDITTISMDFENKEEDSTLTILPLNVTESSMESSTTETKMVKTISPRTTSVSSRLTSPRTSTTTVAEQVTASGISGDIFTDETLEPEESSTTNVTMDSTTSNVEYEFVGLTDSTVSQEYTLKEEDFASSTVSSYFHSSNSTSTTILSTSKSSSTETETTVENVETEGTSTYPETFSTEIDKNQDSTTILSTPISGQHDDMTSWSKETEATTTEHFSSTETIESTETTTEMIPEDSTNFTIVTEFTVDITNTTDSGRSVDSSRTIIPEISAITENFNSTLVLSTESSNLTIVTDTWKVTTTSTSSIEDSSSSTSPKEMPTESSEPDSSSESFTTLQNSINIATGNATIPGNRAVSQEELTSLVRIIFEGSWIDVCPHLPALRQSLADLLTLGLEKTVLASQIKFQKNPCSDGFAPSTLTTELSVTTLLLYVADKNGNLDSEMTKILPSLYNRSPIKLQVTIHSFQLVQDADSGNAIAVVVVSCVALICLILLAGLLFIMRKRQTRFNYGERCRPVSLDAYSLDSVSAYNSVRGRKGAVRASKRSYGNPTFEDSTAIPSHPLNFAGLSTFCNEQNTIAEEFTGIPQVTARIDELPQGAEVKNRYANVVPLPETRVSLMKINNDPLTEYINASYVRGPKNATKYYIACQAPIESTITDFWRMIWEQQSKVVIMLTDLVENGVEKCAEYMPPSEVTDCHRLFGDFQVTLKKRETKEKYAISTLHLKNLENNTFREISHIWYLWPVNGVQSDAAGLIAVLLEARALQRGGPGPVVVHCSPGTGRTGTLIALDLGIRQYEITRTVDVPRVVYTIRRDRAGAVQTKEQYAFIYKALNLYATKLSGGALES